jgi:hypothetical protein
MIRLHPGLSRVGDLIARGSIPFPEERNAGIEEL